MIFISVTRLHLRSYIYLLPFMWYSLLSKRQAQKSRGLIVGKLMGDGKRAFWTVTAWSDESAMKAFRIGEPHRAAMSRLLNWCDEASVVHRLQETADLPDRNEAHRQMLTGGRISKVNYPSPAQAGRQTAEPACMIRYEGAPWRHDQGLSAED